MKQESITMIEPSLQEPWLRDWFAKSAFEQLVKNREQMVFYNDDSVSMLAKRAYQIADILMEAKIGNK